MPLPATPSSFQLSRQKMISFRSIREIRTLIKRRKGQQLPFVKRLIKSVATLVRVSLRSAVASLA